jgi:hypothetical protein
MPIIPRSLSGETTFCSESLDGKSMSKSRACWTVSPSMTLNNKLAKPLVVGASGGALKNNLAQLF